MKVSVALATYNGARFLREQLESLEAQSRPVNEIVLCDDASKDATLTIAREFAQKWSARSVLFRIEKNDATLGVVKNFEKAARLCTGDVVFLCDQDDYWHHDKVARLMHEFENRPDLLFLYSNAQLVDSRRETLGITQFDALAVTRHERALVRRGQAFEALVIRNLVTGATAAFRRQLLSLALPFPNDWVHDEWLAIVAAAVGVIDLVDECLVDYRQHDRNEIGMERKTTAQRFADLFAARGTFYHHEAIRARTLLSHLETLDNRVTLEKRERLRARVAHLGFRANLPANRLARLLPVAREAGSGRYSQYGRGFRSIVRDLFETF